MAKYETQAVELTDGPDKGKFVIVTLKDGAEVNRSTTVYANQAAAERAIERRAEGRTPGSSGFKPIGN